uniref:Uncharacterized protein n=1 Tax=Glossina pallidipes TaxID=7398 RepID=A0A1B0A9K2_GLOPL
MLKRQMKGRRGEDIEHYITSMHCESANLAFNLGRGFTSSSSQLSPQEICVSWDGFIHTSLIEGPAYVTKIVKHKTVGRLTTGGVLRVSKPRRLDTVKHKIAKEEFELQVKADSSEEAIKNEDEDFLNERNEEDNSDLSQDLTRNLNRSRKRTQSPNPEISIESEATDDKQFATSTENADSSVTPSTSKRGRVAQNHRGTFDDCPTRNV